MTNRQPDNQRPDLHPLTPFKRAVLSILGSRGRQTWNIGCHPSHRTRVLRELQEDGYVTYARTTDRWSLTPRGEVERAA